MNIGISFYRLNEVFLPTLIFLLVSMSCGDSAAENGTYQVMTTYSTTTSADPCTYEICRMSADVCKLRIDFTVRISHCDVEKFDQSIFYFISNSLSMFNVFNSWTQGSGQIDTGQLGSLNLSVPSTFGSLGTYFFI